MGYVGGGGKELTEVVASDIKRASDTLSVFNDLDL